jgi:hypothetical protein
VGYRQENAALQAAQESLAHRRANRVSETPLSNFPPEQRSRILGLPNALLSGADNFTFKLLNHKTRSSNAGLAQYLRAYSLMGGHNFGHSAKNTDSIVEKKLPVSADSNEVNWRALGDDFRTFLLNPGETISELRV